MTVNTVYRKIKELSAIGMRPRAPIYINTLIADLNMNSESISPLITELVDLRLIKYNEIEKQAVMLTLLGTTVMRSGN